MNEKRERGRTIAALMAGTTAPIESEEAQEARSRERRLARLAWAMERSDALQRAIKAADAAWMALVAPYSDRDEDEEMPELDPPPEQEALDAIFAEINAVLDHDRWPAHLYWSY